MTPAHMETTNWPLNKYMLVNGKGELIFMSDSKAAVIRAWDQHQAQGKYTYEQAKHQ